MNKYRTLLKAIIFPIAFTMLCMQNFQAQSVDNTGLFGAVKSFSNDTVIFASTKYHDVDMDNMYDASFVLSSQEISAWSDYSISASFYAEGILVWDGSGFTNTNVVTFNPEKRVDLWFDVDVATKTYNTWVQTESMSAPVLIQPDAAFRKTDIDSIFCWSTLHNPDAEPDSLSVETVELVQGVGVYPTSYSNASLLSLSLSTGSLAPSFDPSITSYSVLLPEGTPSVTVDAEVEIEGATITGTGYIDVSGGSSSANIVVTAKDGVTQKIYTVDLQVDGNYAIYLPGGADGANSNVDLSGLNLSTLPATIECWIYPEGDQNAYAGIFYHRGTADAGLQFAAGWQGLNKLRMNYQGSSIVTDPIEPDTWHHVAIVMTTTSNTLYVDGKPYSSGASQTAYDFSTDNLYLGWDKAVADRVYKGMIDEVRVWNLALDSATLADNLFTELQGNEVGLIGYWNFDDQAASATDSTSNGLDGTITGGTYKPAFVKADSDGDGIYNFQDNCSETANAYQADLDGDGIGDSCDPDIDGDGIANEEDNCPETCNADQLDIDEDGIGDVCDPELPEGLNFALSLPGLDGNKSNVDISGLNLTSLPATIEFWVLPSGTQSDNTGLFYHRDAADAGIQYTSSWQGSGKLRLMFENPSRNYGVVSKEIKPDEWHHVAMVLTETTRSIYVDGIATSEDMNLTGYDFSTGGLYLGWDNATSNRAFKGLMDEVRVWNTARSTEELQTNSHTVLNGDEAGLIAYWNFDDRGVLATDVTGNGNDGTITGGTYVLSSLLMPMVYQNSTTAQKNAIVGPGTTDNIVIALEINSKNLGSPLKLSEINISTTGTTEISDIANAKLYATGKDSTFSTNNLIAELGTTPDEQSFTLFTDFKLSYEKNYFWLTYDIVPNAAKGNLLDASVDSFSLAGLDTITYSPTISAPAENLEINPDLFIQNAKLGKSVVTSTAYITSNGANFVSFQQNAIMTYKGYQYVTYWNTAKHVCLSRKKMPSGNWEELEFTDYTSPHDLGDNHYNISFGICKNDGTIHIAFDHHNDPLNYRVSNIGLANKPDSILLWSTESFSTKRNYLVKGQVLYDNGGEFAGAITYPRFISKPNGDLLFECRTGWSGDGNSHLWEYSGETGTWQHIGEYMHGREDGMPIGYTSKCGYINGLHYTPGGTRLHVSLVWRETPNASTNHEIYYAYSDDDGRTWYNAEGTQISTTGTTPLTYNSTGFKIFSVGENRGLINQEAQAVDSKGRIHILQSYLLDSEPDNSAWPSSRYEAWLRHIYMDETGTWKNDSIASVYIDRSDMAVDSYDNLYVITPGYRVYFASAVDNWANWSEFDISQNGTATAEGLIDREALLNDHVLSFVFASNDYSNNKGEVIVPYYLIERSEADTGKGLNIMEYYNGEWDKPISQELNAVNLLTDNLPATDTTGFRLKGILKTDYAEAYTIYLTTTGSVKVWINDSLMLTTGNQETASEFEIPLVLIPSHNYSLLIEGEYSSDNVSTTLEWSSKTQEKVLIPIENLYSELEDVDFYIPDTVITNIEIAGEQEVKCFPNPFKDSFTIECEGIFTYTLMDIHGRVLDEGAGFNNTTIGNKLNKGMYILKVSKQNNKEFIKITKL